MGAGGLTELKIQGEDDPEVYDEDDKQEENPKVETEVIKAPSE